MLTIHMKHMKQIFFNMPFLTGIKRKRVGQTEENEDDIYKVYIEENKSDLPNLLGSAVIIAVIVRPPRYQ